ncbi:hypothetical protein CF326_g9842, partial [Tilletia indica]
MAAPLDDPTLLEDDNLLQQQSEKDKKSRRLKLLFRKAADESEQDQGISDELRQLAPQGSSSREPQDTRTQGPEASGSGDQAEHEEASEEEQSRQASMSPGRHAHFTGDAPIPSGSSIHPRGTSEVSRASAERGSNISGSGAAKKDSAALLSEKAQGKRRRMESGTSTHTRKEARLGSTNPDDVPVELLSDEAITNRATAALTAPGRKDEFGRPIVAAISPGMVRSMAIQDKEDLLQILLDSMPSGAGQSRPIEELQQATPAQVPVQRASTLEKPPTHSTFPGQDMRRSATEPVSLSDLSFVPSRTRGSHTRMPHISVINKMVAGQFVPLWHFTVEGIAVGFEKGQEAKSLLDKLGV